ncbi:MAG: methyltransferase domain-containing protein [Anaerolineae bacterium]|nr:methyltransferase domain-containing protein [Anaerolineae bacterium]
MSLTPEEWHHWFTVQARWTWETRLWLYRQAGLAGAQLVLEVGCGSGVVAEELACLTSGRVVGLDVDPRMIELARRRSSDVRYLRGDAYALPFPSECFDIVVSHYLFLWLKHPEHAAREMARVVRAGGAVLACAEPDYGGRVDYPPELGESGRLQAEALRRQGADPLIGRRLGELFVAAGLRVTLGVVGGQWELPSPAGAGEEFEAEWDVREPDLAALCPPDKLRRWRDLDRRALQSGQRVLFVPTFYAWGRKK